MRRDIKGLILATWLILLATSGALATEPPTEILGTLPTDADTQNQRIFAASVSNDGSRAAVFFDGGDDRGRGLVVYDVRSGKVLRKYGDSPDRRVIGGHISPSGDLAVVTFMLRPMSGPLLEVHRIDNNEVLYRYEQNGGSVTAAFDSSSRKLVHLFSEPNRYETRQGLRCVDLGSTKTLWEWTWKEEEPSNARPRWSSDGSRVFVHSVDAAELPVIDAKTGATAFVIKADPARPIVELGASGDGKCLGVVHAGGKCEIYDLMTGQRLASVEIGKLTGQGNLTSDLQWRIASHAALLEARKFPSGGDARQLRPGPRPTSRFIMNEDGRTWIIIVDGERGGDMQIARLPDSSTWPKSQTATQPVADVQATPAAPIPQHTPADLRSIPWWLSRAEAETKLVASNYDRAHLLYQIAEINARAGNLGDAEAVLKQADALKQPPSVPREWRSNEKLRTYYATARLVARLKGADDARRLLDQLSPDDRSNADWMPEAAVAVGRAEAGDVAAAIKVIEPLRGEPRREVAMRVLMVLTNAGKLDDAERVVQLIPEGSGRPIGLAQIGVIAARSGDFDRAIRMFELLASIKGLQPSFDHSLAEEVAYHAAKAKRKDVIDALTGKASPRLGASITRGVLRDYVDRNDLDGAEKFAKTLPERGKREARGVLMSAYAKRGDLKRVIELGTPRADEEPAWGMVLSRLVAAKQLDEALNFVADPRFRELGTRERMDMIGSLVDALLKAGRPKEVEQLIEPAMLEELDFSGRLTKARAVALWQLGRKAAYQEALVVLGGTGGADASVPAGFGDSLIVTAALEAGDLETAWQHLQRLPPGPPSPISKSGALVQYVHAAAVSGDQAALIKGLREQEAVDSDSAMVPLGALFVANLPEARIKQALDATQHLRTARCRARTMIWAARALLSPDLAERQFVDWGAGE